MNTKNVKKNEKPTNKFNKIWRKAGKNGHLRRLNKNLISKFIENCSNAENAQNEIVNIDNNSSESVNNMVENDENDVDNLDENEQQLNFNNIEITSNYCKNNFLKDLKFWGINHQIKRSAFDDLLHVFHKHNVYPDQVPKDSRTVIGKMKTVCIEYKEQLKGWYWHNSMAFSLKRVLENHIRNNSLISLKINVDGLPIFEHSRMEFWPILVSIHEIREIDPIVAGIYYGHGEFLKKNTFKNHKYGF